MEDKRMNSILRLAQDTAKTGVWHDKKDFDFQNDEEIEMYVMTAYEIMRNDKKNVVWNIPTD